MNARKIFRSAVTLAFIAATSLTVPTGSAAVAQSTGTPLQTALAQFLTVSANDTLTLGSSSSVSTCPTGYRCTGQGTTMILLVAYAIGDGAGSAVVLHGVGNCPGCYQVLYAGGGPMSLAVLESVGIPADLAQTLMSE
jgi:hypothetical protein